MGGSEKSCWKSLLVQQLLCVLVYSRAMWVNSLYSDKLHPSDLINVMLLRLVRLDELVVFRLMSKQKPEAKIAIYGAR